MKETPIDRRHQRPPLAMEPEEFRELGHALVDRLAELIASLDRGERPVTPAETPAQVRALVGDHALPAHGEDAAGLLEEAASLLIDHSLFNGHPSFFGYVTSSAAPLGALADLLASALNINMGAWALAPIATEIEVQTVRWIAELIGYPTGCGGLLVSGGNVANFVGFVAARRAVAPWDVRRAGMAAEGAPSLRVYASTETHTWLHKAADQYGLGTDAICWLPADRHQRLDPAALEEAVRADREAGRLPAIVVGNAGTVSTGAVDPLDELADVCRAHGLWLHVDGAYGALAASVDEAPASLRGLAQADSVAVDPHKWLYAPVEAGCALVRDPARLRDAFSYSPAYYAFEDTDEPMNFYEYGPQNSRGFRALKVWLGLRRTGREGAATMIRDDIALARRLYERVATMPELEPLTYNLSIVTFRYVPRDLELPPERARAYLDELNTKLLFEVQRRGRAYLSNAVLPEGYALRACIVNFRTRERDVDALPAIITEVGRELDRALRPRAPRG
jgi:aromatic-L-amino-acid/L-tryptophan decarboxylase